MSGAVDNGVAEQSSNPCKHCHADSFPEARSDQSLWELCAPHTLRVAASLLEPDLGDGLADLFDVVDVDRVYEHVRSPNTRKLVESAPLSTLPLSEHLAKAICDLGRSLINDQFVTALKNDLRRHGAASLARCP